MPSGRTVQKRRTSRPPSGRPQVRPVVEPTKEDLYPEVSAPRWPAISGLLICVAGFAVAGYLTYDHYTGSAPAACPATKAIDCVKVTTSSYSEIHGVPVTDLGLIFFAVMFVLQLPRLWASTSPAVRGGRLLWAVVGMTTALWLIYAELFKIDSICLYCTSVHVLTLLVFATTVFATLATAPLPADE